MSQIRLCLLLALLLLAVSGSYADETWTWKAEVLDTAGAFTAMTADKGGNIHLAYSGSKGLTYAFRPYRGSRWFSMVVDSSAGFGRDIPGIAVDASGLPAVCYSTVDSRLKYAYMKDKRWYVQEIAARSGEIGYTCSTGIAADGTRHVVWYQLKTLAGDYFHLKHAVLQNGAWMARTVDLGPETGKWNSMVIDSAGIPHLAYSCWDQSELRYATWNGKSWDTQAVDGGTSSFLKGLHIGPGAWLVLDKDSRPRISYQQENAVKYAKFADGKWTTTLVDQITTAGSWLDFRTSMVLDSGGFAHIVYQDSGVLKHAYQDEAGWHIQIIAAPGTEAYRYASVAVTPDDTLFIAYRDAADGTLKVASGRRQQVQPQRKSAESRDPQGTPNAHLSPSGTSANAGAGNKTVIAAPEQPKK